jgi:hypothetical protein
MRGLLRERSTAIPAGADLRAAGYELAEGAVAEGVMRKVREVRRASFAPEASRTTSRD